MERKDSQVIRDLLVFKDLLEARVLLDFKVKKVNQDRLEKMVTTVL